ncbi:MAG: hypothetical protein PHY27_12395 [Parabacteroides sp.]|jgi:hypothetical protein|nr:hypothetical protein [Parabacteroides sp.]
MAKSKKPRIISQDQVRQFIKENEIQSVEDIQNVLKDMFVEALQGRLEGEMDTHLRYQKHEDARRKLQIDETTIAPKQSAATTEKPVWRFPGIERVTSNW